MSAPENLPTTSGQTPPLPIETPPKPTTPPISALNSLTQLNRLRTNIRYALIFVIILTLIIVNISSQLFTNLTLINFTVIASLIYSILYTFVIARFLNNRWLIFLGASSLLLPYFLIAQVTGGNESIFFGFLYLFVAFIGVSVGFIPLFIFSLIVEAMILFFWQGRSDIVAITSLFRNSLLNIVTFIIGYIVMVEYTMRGKDYTQITSLVEDQKRLSQEKDDIISIISHEFRTPVTAIKGYLDLLNKKIADPDQKEYVQKAEINVGKLQSIMENTLNVSVLESGVMALFLQPIDLEKVTTETIDSSLLIQAEKKNLKININLPKVRLPLISADPQRLKQIIVNLVSNAIKYTDQGSINVSLEREGDFVVLIVADTGRGISQDDMPKLFQKFFRGGDFINRTIEGTGLGLYISKKLVEKQNGTIEVTSELNKGTTFKVRLPVPSEDETWIH